MKNLFILNGPSSNRGCEAILLSTYKLISQAFEESSFINSSVRDPRAKVVDCMRFSNLRHECHPENLSASMLYWQFAKRIGGARFYFERYLNWSDMVYSLGGDNYSLDYGNALSLFEANERVYAKGKKLVIWGASIGPFKNVPEVEKIAKENLKKAYRIVVRETITQQYLGNLDIVDNVVLMPDPAFSLTPIKINLPFEVEAMLSDGAIGLNLSPLLARYRKNPANWIAEASSWLNEIIEKIPFPVLLIPHVMEVGNDDQNFMHKMLDKVKDSSNSNRVFLLDSYGLSSQHLKYVISRLRVFVGARTHATIAAMSTGVPTISIGYSIKAKGINQDLFGNEDWVLDHHDLNGTLIVNKINDLLAEESKIRSYLAKKMYKMTSEGIRSALKSA